MTDKNENRRDELCERFRQSLTQPGSTQYFDEDDLIEIFDYAGDLNDDYLRLEALLCGARYYPDSVALRQRRALLYYTFGDDITQKFLDDNNSQHGMIWDITRTRNANPMGAEAIEALNQILKDYPEFDDEEVIQFVDLASSLGCNDWLLSNLDALRAHVTYLPTLLYEIAVMLEIDHRYGESITLLEELTNLEPYNEQYWFMLAQEHDLNDDSEAALQALDLALAILPNDKAMRFYHARILSQADSSRPQAIKELESLYKEFPSDMEIARLLAALHINAATDKNQDVAHLAACIILNNCFQLNKGNRQLASDILAIGAADPYKTIAEVDRVDPPSDVAGWVSWAAELEALHAFAPAIDILNYCHKKLGHRTPAVNEALVIDHFSLKQFKEVCSTFESSTIGGSEATPDNAATVFVAYAVSLAMTGRKKEAVEFSNMILKLIVDDGPDEISYALRRIGVHVVLTDLIQRCKSRKAVDWKNYDPLGIW